MIFEIIFLLLLISFSIHLLAIVFYLISKTRALLYLFLLTTFSNIILAMILTIHAFKNPESVRSMNVGLVLWWYSGFIALMMLVIKIVIFKNILKRKNDPGMYHINYFGKKVYHSEIVKKWEMAVVFLTMPIFVIFGAYFISKFKMIFQ